MRKTRNIWTWLKPSSPPPVPPSHAHEFGRARLYGQFNDGFTVFGPYERPIEDATGGGQLYARTLAPRSPNYVYPQQWVPVSITGKGSELTGQLDVLGLVNVTNGNTGSGGQV